MSFQQRFPYLQGVSLTTGAIVSTNIRETMASKKRQFWDQRKNYGCADAVGDTLQTLSYVKAFDVK